jgi:DNA-binding NtrC family response regulator
VSDTQRRFLLRGELGGQERRVPLATGEVSIGSAPVNDLVLPLRGVSRHHARLLVDADGADLEDLGSKNGVAVNGRLVQKARLKAGDEIRLGPVVMRLEQADPEDVELAIAVQARPRTPSTRSSSEETTSAVRDLASGAELALQRVEGFLLRLPASGQAGEALAFLVAEVEAAGACLLEWSAGRDEPAILAAHGRLPELANDPLNEWVRRSTPKQGETVVSARLEGSPNVAAAVVAGPSIEPLGLVAWGETAHQPEHEALLRALVLSLHRSLPRGARAGAATGARREGRLRFPAGYIRGDSPRMTALYREMETLSEGDLPVLILGETGVGKEYLARALHASSRRSGGPFVPLNCAAIPADLLESELFGIARGIATGVSERPGKFQLASGGTLFLDEIGDMSADLQAKLLRALQEKEVQPVGGAAVAVDLRVVAATNSDLGERIEAGRFRRDLYYRIAGVTLDVPPLRERKEDIPLLVEGFVRAFSREAGKSVRGLTVKALRALVAHHWPGNVRELEHEIQRLVHLCPDGQAIDSAMLGGAILKPRRDEPSAPPAAEGDAELGLEGQVDLLEGRLIRRALERAGGNRTQAAKLLGVSRNGLAIKMKRLAIPD